MADNETCKVADFGLLREIPKDNTIYMMHTNVPCPIRWMAPESISQRKFSTASDVWSFGVLQWEMFNPKKMPYGSFSNMEIAMKVCIHVHVHCSYYCSGLYIIFNFAHGEVRACNIECWEWVC